MRRLFIIWIGLVGRSLIGSVGVGGMALRVWAGMVGGGRGLAVGASFLGSCLCRLS